MKIAKKLNTKKIAAAYLKLVGCFLLTIAIFAMMAFSCNDPTANNDFANNSSSNDDSNGGIDNSNNDSSENSGIENNSSNEIPSDDGNTNGSNTSDTTNGSNTEENGGVTELVVANFYVNTVSGISKLETNGGDVFLKVNSASLDVGSTWTDFFEIGLDGAPSGVMLFANGQQSNFTSATVANGPVPLTHFSSFIRFDNSTSETMTNTAMVRWGSSDAQFGIYGAFDHDQNTATAGVTVGIQFLCNLNVDGMINPLQDNRDFSDTTKVVCSFRDAYGSASWGPGAQLVGSVDVAHNADPDNFQISPWNDQTVTFFAFAFKDGTAVPTSVDVSDGLTLTELQAIEAIADKATATPFTLTLKVVDYMNF